MMKKSATQLFSKGLYKYQVSSLHVGGSRLHPPSEAADALNWSLEQHWGEKGGLRLDRERKVGRRLSYRIVGPDAGDRELVQGLLYSSYHPHEPITLALGLHKGRNSIPDADRLVDSLLTKNLTVLAEDIDTGEPVGVAVNNVCHLENLTAGNHEAELAGCLDPRYRPMLAIRQQLRLSSLHIYEELGTDKFFSIRMVGVEPRARGQGVATDLIRRSVLLAGCLGYVGINAIASGTFAKGAFSAIGLLPTTSINYSSFTYEGEKIFQGVPNIGGQDEIVLLKKKFFQSALKHIL